MAKAYVSVAILAFLLIQHAQTQELVSDGTNNTHQITFLKFKGMSASAESCKHMYSFLPCTDNIAGHIFQIFIYQYLLYVGETYVSKGSDLLFKILGPLGFFGASVFHILGVLPEAIIVLASGLSKSKEIAQEQVFSGVGLLSGSTIFLLTIVWGTCVIVGQREFTETSKNKDIESSSSNDSRQQIRHSSFLTGHGIITDLETSHTAMIMVLSVVPFIIVQLPQLVNQPSWASIVILTSLIVSVLFLFGFFLYQVFEPWIPKRRLEYAKNDHLMVDFLKHVQKQASGRLLTKQGAPNPWAIRRLFASIDLDANNCLTANELQEKILDLMSDKIHPNDKDAVEDIMKEFDLNQDLKVSFDEFQHMFGKWLLKVKHEVNNHGSVVQSSIDNLYKERMIEHKNSRDLMEITNHLPTDALGIFYNDDGEPNFNNLKGVSEKFDHDKDNFITSSELRELIHSMGKKGSKTDEVIEKFMKVLDKDGDGKIDEQEFVEGLSALFGSVKTLDDIYQEAWVATDKEIESGQEIKGSKWIWCKSTIFLLFGTAVLTLLAEPLIDSVQNFSEAVSIPSFYISFIVIPLATNSREAVSAIMAASNKKPRTTSLTFSEIYGGVIMNNILGLSLLLSIVYARDLTWNFSAEVLVLVIICAVMGALCHESSLKISLTKATRHHMGAGSRPVKARWSSKLFEMPPEGSRVLLDILA